MIKILLSLLIPVSVFAGPYRVGNGGNGIEKNGQVYLLDLCEVGVENNPYYSAIQDTLFLQQVEQTFDRQIFPTEMISAKLAEIYSKDKLTATSFLMAMQKVNWIFVDYPLEKTPDIATPIQIDPDKILQIANRFYGQVIIQKSLWEKMPKNNQAALVFHEMIYALMSSNKPEYQVNIFARQIVGRIFSQVFAKMNTYELNQLTGMHLPSLSFIAAVNRIDTKNAETNRALALYYSEQDQRITFAPYLLSVYSTDTNKYVQIDASGSTGINLKGAANKICAATQPERVHLKTNVFTMVQDEQRPGFFSWEIMGAAASLVSGLGDFCTNGNSYKLLEKAIKDELPFWEIK